MLSEAMMIFLMSIYKPQTGAVQPWEQRRFCQHSVYLQLRWKQLCTDMNGENTDI